MSDIDKQAELLVHLKNANEPILDEIEKRSDPSYGALVIGVKLEDETENEEAGLITYLSATGSFDAIAEGLFTELLEMMQSGDASLFSVLREVVRDIEQELDINPEDELDGTSDTPVTLH